MIGGIRVDLRPAIAALGDLSARQVPFASALALTTLAQGVQDTETELEIATFDNPTPFTKRAFGKTPATKRNLVATVFIKNRTSAAGGQNAYLEPYIDGGQRSLGTKEAMLVPIGQRTNQYGNLPRNTLARLKARPDVFIGKVTFKKNGRTVSGVWQRSPIKRGKRRDGDHGTRGDSQGKVGSARTTLKLLIEFEDTTEAPKHFDFYGAARAYVAKHGQRVFNEALAKAMAMPRR